MIKIGFHNFRQRNDFADRMLRKAKRAVKFMNINNLDCAFYIKKGTLYYSTAYKGHVLDLYAIDNTMNGIAGALHHMKVQSERVTSYFKLVNSGIVCGTLGSFIAQIEDGNNPPAYPTWNLSKEYRRVESMGSMGSWDYDSWIDTVMESECICDVAGSIFRAYNAVKS